MNELEQILKLSAQAQTCVYETIRNIRMQELDAKAHLFGYSFSHFSEFGTWRKYAELEPVENPCKPVESRVFASIAVKATCNLCGSEFSKTRPNKIFCSEICRNKFHNLNKPMI